MVSSTEIAQMIDHTLLKATATYADIEKLCQEAKEFNFKSVCVNPAFVPFASQLLKDSEIKVCTVIGFPLGATSTAVKAYEASWAVENGALEVDMVINIGALKAGRYEEVLEDIKEVVSAAKGKNPTVVVKVIIETCYLTDEEKIKACELAVEAGADFVKTSTGFGTGGATVEDVRLMKRTVGEKAEVKASGGIRSFADAIKMIEAGATRLGTSSGVLIMQGLVSGEDY
ncbi:deoxyribose-phosphate aldolase [Carboxydothermus ferrireducens]|uniref:Deoxyribose-phosphate aldolase n=1 Tax=Carboxydothermus ferrireducens DSM 11255 TaxID=1119529 RepID=A0ABX2RAW4_9THEO|nr:deoxyribose-phosphate aldolase [Carboxydothermus ferrireducens]NYE58322.1 deoxyribose-phosphate aldolase [Carboxydothermus ferrireducens DSM 11255]